MQAVYQQYPEWHLEIVQLCRESTDFRELCQDYEEVHAVLTTWKGTDKTDANAVKELETLSHDLEDEITNYLTEFIGDTK